MENIRVLSSDEYEGRALGTKGEELSIAFIEERCKEIGLLPANHGSYFQNVGLVGITTDGAAELIFGDRENQMTLRYGEDFVAWSKHQNPQVVVSGDLVFVGYGIQAPEYDWDDFKETDVKDKILVVLINDPPIPDPNDPSKLDENMFKGKAMTYYGRWTYKFEMAAKKGAKGCLIVHQTQPARYPWEVVENSFTREQFSLASTDPCKSCPIEGWITYEKAKELFKMAGKDFDAMAGGALSPDFHPVALNMSATLALQSTIRTIESKNVVAELPGSDADLAEECIVYSAHWDHLGMGSTEDGSPIYHGAIDNASGVAGLLEIASSLTQIEPRPKRSILFLFTTAEESGLLGSQYYVEHPLLPNTIANINFDGLNLWGLAKDISVIGLGQSSLDEILEDVANGEKRELTADSAPENGACYRGDLLNFLKIGVPSIWPSSGTDFIGQPPGWGKIVQQKYTAEDYHKPSDQLRAYFTPCGAIEDLKFLAEVGCRIANAKERPSLKAGSEFRKKLSQSN